MFIYTLTLHHYVTLHYKHNTVHAIVLLWLYLYRGKNWEIKLIIRKLVKCLRKNGNRRKQFTSYVFISRKLVI